MDYKFCKSPRDLLTFNRLDVGFKLFYLRFKNIQPELARSVYIKHIDALTLGTFCEPGSSSKKSASDFISEFDKIYESLRDDGFNEDVSRVPIINGSIANGAHRLAAAIYLDIPIVTEDVSGEPHIYDYKFFRDRSVPDVFIKLAVSEVLSYSERYRAAILWPKSIGFHSDICRSFVNVLYSCEQVLDFNELANLIFDIYDGDDWIGSPGLVSSGAYTKALSCYQENSILRMLVFESESLDHTISIKNKIRSTVGVGKAAIHTSDTAIETYNVFQCCSSNWNKCIYGDISRFNKVHRALNDDVLHLKLKKDSSSLKSSIFECNHVVSAVDMNNINLRLDENGIYFIRGGVTYVHCYLQSRHVFVHLLNKDNKLRNFANERRVDIVKWFFYALAFLRYKCAQSRTLRYLWRSFNEWKR